MTPRKQGEERERYAPTPWRYEKDEEAGWYLVIDANGKAVRGLEPHDTELPWINEMLAMVNAHDALVEALEDACIELAAEKPDYDYVEQIVQRGLALGENP